MIFSNPAEALLLKAGRYANDRQYAGQVAIKEVTEAAAKEGEKLAQDGAQRQKVDLQPNLLMQLLKKLKRQRKDQLLLKKQQDRQYTSPKLGAVYHW